MYARSLLSVLAVALAVVSGAHAQQAAAPIAAQVVTVKGVVENVDYTTRVLTLRQSDGSTAVVTVSPEVANLAQIQKGDQVTVQQVAPMAVAGTGSNVVVDAARPGQQAAKATLDTEEVTAVVESIDHASRTVVLRGTDGKLRTIKVDQSVPMDDVKPGDSATLRITRAYALAVEKPAS